MINLTDKVIWLNNIETAIFQNERHKFTLYIIILFFHTYFNI